MKAISKIAILLSIAVCSSSCIKEKLEETYNKQDEQIDKYITGLLEKNESYTATYNDGVSRLTTKAGEGPELSSNGSISFYYAGYTFSGSINPALKRQGYGKKLLDYCLEKATAMGFGAVLFEGNIGFYGKTLQQSNATNIASTFKFLFLSQPSRHGDFFSNVDVPTATKIWSLV